MKKITYLFIAAISFAACEKELSLEGGGAVITEPKQEPKDTAAKYQLTAFYSDIPIDFDESDSEVRQETDLWAYVLDYVKDDYHILRNDTIVEVLQNSIKMPGLKDEVLYKKYLKGTDGLGDYILYLTFDYSQTKYRLYELTDDHFIIGLKWKDGARVYSRFDRVE